MFPVLLPIFVAIPEALACGGMFCDQANPVDQAAERIVFAWEPDGDGGGGGIITTEVQIAFSGESDDFAWVVPVSDVPDLFTSNDALFTTLANRTIPTFALSRDNGGTCDDSRSTSDSGAVDFASSSPSDDTDAGVNVVATQTVGPYDTVILQATDTNTLVSWLQEQGYGIPGNIEPVVRPYVAAGQYFVALKLSADRSTGDLAPLGMRYHGTAASIPIQLTSIAAVPDLPIEVFVLGPSRAVPDNYLHVRLNDAAIDWFSGGSNYRDVVRRAADEAGGNAFATDFSGSTQFLQNALWSEGRLDLGYLRSEYDPTRWLENIVFSGTPSSSQLTNLLISLVPPPEGVDATSFLSCPSCYEVEVPGWDPVAATGRLEGEIVDVLRAEQAMIDGAPQLTRLFTTMDAAEMTADPLFVFNSDVDQDLTLTHTAVVETRCNILTGEAGAQVLTLEDGRQIGLPSAAWLADHDMTEFEYMEELTSPAALVIEDLGAEGQGTILFDFREAAAEAAMAFGTGCGCASSGASPLPAGLLLLGGIALRRRRSA